MRIKALPGDFVVEERANLALRDAGAWAIYRVRKVGLTTLQVQRQLAGQLHLSAKQVLFPALKDKQAVAIQYASLPAGHAERLQGDSFEAQRIGYREHPLRPADLRGNVFTVVLRELDAHTAPIVRRRLLGLGAFGLPNYFDAQRMGSFAPDWGFIGKAILQRDASAALYGYLTQVFIGDPRPVRAFKRAAAELWPDWRKIIEIAPRPSNYRSVLTYLIDHPDGYRKALNLIPQRLLSLYLAAYQSHLWNRIAGAYLEHIYRERRIPMARLSIADASLPYHTALPADAVAALREQQAALPHHRAYYQPRLLYEMATQVLQAEGLTPTDLKARILQRAYLPRGQRPLLLWPQDLWAGDPLPDERFGGLMLRAGFALPKGSYATLLLKVAAGEEAIAGA